MYLPIEERKLYIELQKVKVYKNLHDGIMLHIINCKEYGEILHIGYMNRVTHKYLFTTDTTYLLRQYTYCIQTSMQRILK